MNYYVRVKQGHPTGVRRRSGLTFTQDETMVSELAMTDVIRTDSWLQIRVVGESLTPSGPAPTAGDPPLSAEERERLTTFAANLHASAIAESDAASAAAAAGTEEQAEGAGEKADADGGGDKTATRRGRGK